MSEKPENKEKKTLEEGDIVSGREGEDVSRRSMLGALGAIAATGAAAAVIPGCYVRRGYGRAVYGQPGVVVAAPGVQGRYATGVTDSDGGPYADPAGYGRGQRRSACAGITDSDGGAYADPAGCGRGVYGRTSGITDSDGGPYADPAGNGRGTVRVGYTGITDSDGGPYADPAGQGRGRWR